MLLFLNDWINIWAFTLYSLYYTKLIRSNEKKARKVVRHQTGTLANEKSEESLLIHVFIVNRTPINNNEML